MDLFKSHVGRLRITAFLEGISFLLLLGIAMPIKYVVGFEGPVKVIGMAHGILFIGYIILLIPVKVENEWSLKTTLFGLAASILPLGTFVFDAKILKKIH